jgi:hypothetical protein
MNPWEAQSRAIIAAALIVRGAVEISLLPSEGERAPATYRPISHPTRPHPQPNSGPSTRTEAASRAKA